MKSNQYKVISLFSGCGGLDLGFIKEGFEVIWANDFFKEAVETYQKNIGSHIVYGDITKIPSSGIPNECDVLLGGFPCQGFSVANTKRSMEDERNFLYKELLRLLKDKQPKFFVAENVKGLLSIQKGQVIEMIVQDFKSLGYCVDYKLLKASDYGVPQHRERVIIIGNRLGLKNPFPKKTHGLCNDLFNKKLKPYVCVKDVVGHLANVRTRDASFMLDGVMIHNHVARTNVYDTFWGRKHPINQHEICDYLKFWRSRSTYSTKQIDEYFGYAHTAGHWFRKDNNSGSIPKVQDWWELKKLLKFDDTYDKAVTELELKEIKFEQSLRINNWELPSDTITATGPEIHPNRQRRMSVRECAIIQTFPNDFIFYGSLGRIFNTAIFSNTPASDITPFDLGEEQMSVNLEGPIVNRLQAATQTIISVNIFVPVAIKVPILKTSPSHKIWFDARIQNPTLGVCTLKDDAGYQCVIKQVTLDSNVRDLATSTEFTIKGGFYPN